MNEIQAWAGAEQSWVPHSGLASSIQCAHGA